MKKQKQRLILTLITMWLSLTVMAQEVINVQGTVTDETGEALIGCTVQLKGSTAGVVCDLDGHFKMNAPKGSALVFSYVGYKTLELKATAQMKVTMKEDAHMLNEVVAVGYGTMKRSDITGSVVSVKADDMQQTSGATMDQMLQGRAAGLQLSGNSGAAGSSNSIQIRGINSLNSTNEPIYIIDGVIVQSSSDSNIYSNPLADLNPNDVESIEVLKDASATAIYGSQFKASMGWDKLPRKLDVMNLRQLAEWMKSIKGEAVSDYFSNPETLGTGTDWQDALFRTGMRQEYNASIRGGAKNIKYSVSTGFFGQEGIVINNDFNRLTLRASLDVKAYKWLDLGLTLNLAQTNRNTGMAQWGVVSNALSQTPNIPVKNEDGTWGKSGYNSETNSFQPNPVALASITTRKNKGTLARTNLHITITPWKWLSWRNEGVYESSTDNYRYLLPAYDFGGTVRDYATHQTSKTWNQYWALKRRNQPPLQRLSLWTTARW